MNLYTRTTGNGRDLVLIHGWGMHSAIWESLVAELGRELRITRIDLPGHGHSSYLSAWDSLEAWGEACLQVAPERAVWLGWSLGALIAMAAAGRAPERVAGLISVAGTPRFVQSEDWSHAVPVGTLGQFSNQLREDYRATLERFLALQVRGSDLNRTTLRRLRNTLLEGPQPDSQALALGLDLLRETDLRRQIRTLHCPCLWLLGTRDTLVPAGLAQDLPRLQPRSLVQLIEGAGHAPMLSHVTETAQAVRAFLQ